MSTLPTGSSSCTIGKLSSAIASSSQCARTAKHPDFLDLCIALTGRAPLSGVYLDAPRKARRIVDVDLPDGIDDGFWPLIGYLAGKAAPDRIPLLRGLAGAAPNRDDLKALCAAFGGPHFSQPECQRLADAFAGRPRHPGTHVIVTAGHDVIRQARASGTLARLPNWLV
jgi:predicted aconitase